MGRQGVEQARHHFQVDHRRLVHHQYVQPQRVAGVVAELAGVRAAAEQAVQGQHLLGDGRAHRRVHRQRAHLLADGFGEPRRRLAGRRGQADAQRPTVRHRRRLQQRQQAHHGGGLAGAGAAGDQREAATHRQRAGELLPVDPRCVAGRKQRVQPRGQVVRHGQRLGQPLAQAVRHALLVIPVAAQVQAAIAQQQRAGLLRRVAALPDFDQRAGGQRRLPLRQVQAGEQLRRQARFTGLFPFGRQRQCEIRFVEGDGQVQTHMALTQLVTGQRGGQQQQRRGLWLAFAQETDEGAVQRPQPAPAHPQIQLGDQLIALAQHLGKQGIGLVAQLPGQQIEIHGQTSAWPANRRSSASISARGGRSACTPWAPPRRNRYSAPPMCRS